MPFELSWTIEGEQQLARRLRQVETKISNFSKPFRTSAQMLENVFSKSVFASQGGAIGEKWKRLSPYTVAQKARLGYPADPLVRTGKMKRGFRSIVSTDQAVIYNTAEYFKYHQSNQPRKKLPRRVMMKLADRQKEDIVRIFQQFVREAVS